MTVLYLLPKHADYFCLALAVSKAIQINESLLDLKKSLFSLKIALGKKKKHKSLYLINLSFTQGGENKSLRREKDQSVTAK